MWQISMGGHALYQALLVWCSILSIQINDYDKGSLQSLHPSHPSVFPSPHSKNEGGRKKSVSMLSPSISAIASEMYIFKEIRFGGSYTSYPTKLKNYQVAVM
jgi:hypothetical protein